MVGNIMSYEFPNRQKTFQTFTASLQSLLIWLWRMSQTIKKESDKHIKDEVVVNAIKVMEKNAET